MFLVVLIHFTNASTIQRPPTSNPWCCKKWSVPVLSSRLCLYPWPSGLARRSISSDRVHGRVRGAGRRHLFDPLVSVDDDYEDCQKLLASCMHPRAVKLGPKERGYPHHALWVKWTRLVWWIERYNRARRRLSASCNTLPKNGNWRGIRYTMPCF